MPSMVRTPVRRLGAASLVAAITVLLTACGNQVLMVGDSVTVGAGPAVQSALDAEGWSTTVDARVGRPTDEALAVVRARRGANSRFIIESGYNDAGDPATYRARLAAILDELADADAVVVVTLNESRWYYATANQTIWQLAATHPNVYVADWAAVTRSTPGLVGSDGIHLTTAGSAAMSRLLADLFGPAALPGA